MTTETHRMISKATLPRSRCGSGPAAVKRGSTGLVERQQQHNTARSHRPRRRTFVFLNREIHVTSTMNYSGSLLDSSLGLVKRRFAP